jgi:hypothetical protein
MNSKFFDEVGPHYVYGYWCRDHEEWKYIGKGVGDRVTHHVKDKGYDINDAFILVQNLPDDQCAAHIEALLIEQHHPRDNKVRGHHSEKIIMTSLSSMFKEYTDGQYDHFEKFPDWYLESYDEVFRGRLREVKINSGSCFILSNARNAIYMMWYWYHDADTVKITFEVNQDGDKLESTQEQLVEWLAANGIDRDDVQPDGKKQKMAVVVNDVQTAVELFKEFMS